MNGPLHVVEQYKAGAVEISLEGKVRGRQSEFRVLVYHRIKTAAITLKLFLRSPGWPDVLIREVVGFVATDWFFGESIPLRSNESVVFTTTGAPADEKHHAQMRIEEMRV